MIETPPCLGDLGLLPATDLARQIRDREISSRELLEHVVARHDALHGDINAIVATDLDRGFAEADAADAVTAAGREVGPLHGLPISIKDAIETEGIVSTGGAVELADSIPTADAPVVERVRRNGAIVFGKSNLPRWSADIQATNEMYGTTNNPWDPTRGPGGSSGGAAAAVATGMSTFEIGTDIGGSIRLPAHFSGVCGHKPSFGIVPQRGYISHPTGGISDADVNVFGPLARSVADLELVLDAIAGPLDNDAAAWNLNLPAPRHTKLEDFRVAAWLDDAACLVSSGVASALESTVAALESNGARVERSTRPEVTIADHIAVGGPLISAATSPAYSDDHYAGLVDASLNQSVEAKRRQRAAIDTMRHRDWILLDETRQQHRHRWARFFESYDILLCPVAMTEAFEHVGPNDWSSRSLTVDGETRPYRDLVTWTSMIGYVYLPATVVPVGFTPEGLPVGIQIVAPYLEDRTALSFARIVEQLLGGYQPPPIARFS